MPENVSLADGLTATVEGKAYPSQSGDSSGSNSSNSGSSSGGSGGSSSVKETGHTNEYDPKNPYAGVNVGLFHNIPITVDENTSGVATYYLPRGMDPWAPAVIVLTPDKHNRQEFLRYQNGPCLACRGR
jgi:polyhydroxybutyrate depolymerase